MSNTAKSTGSQKFSIDRSKDKYSSRYQRLINNLFCAKEIPNDLYKHINISYDNFRKTVSILNQRGILKRLYKDGTLGYVLKDKNLTYHLEYMKYQDCLEDDRRQYDIKHRFRKRQFAYLYALLDRIGIPYESFSKPPIDEVTVFGKAVYFYTAQDFKRMMGMESTAFVGSRLLGFLIGCEKVIPVYRTNQALKTFGSHETLVPFYLKRYFTVPVNTAILICDDEKALITITKQIIDNTDRNPHTSINTAQYSNFFVMSSDDTFYDRLYDLFIGCTETENRLIKSFEIDTSETDNRGRYRYIAGTGFLNGIPVMVYAGNVNVVSLRTFISRAVYYDIESCIICKQRDFKVIKEITKNKPIRVIAF